LGIWQIKWELEDFSFRYQDPATYKELSKALNQRRADREQYVKDFITQLTQMLQAAGISNPEITGRAKHIYSIYRKMQRKNVDFSEIYDTTAVRVIVPTVEDCYTVLSSVHGAWQHIPKEFDDYIATPKPNGYKSIHTAVIAPDDVCVEVQIRTLAMHQEAELGVAAHWVYKEGAHQSTNYETKIAWLRQAMAWQKEVTATDDALDEVQNIFDDRIYVFTPGNDIIEMAKSATVLDFAYHIHSEVGHRCRGAKVDANIVNLSYQLKTGETIEILTNKQPHPSRDWLNPHLGFLKTSRAKAKVHSWFKKQDHDKNVAFGQDLLEKELKRLGLKNINIGNLANQLKFKTNEDMFAALGGGELKTTSIIGLIERTTTPATDNETKKPATSAPLTTKTTDIEIQGVDNLLTHLANCCQPIPGDAIIGYITQGRGISIHRQDCSNIVSTKKMHPERLIEIDWGMAASHNYPVNLVIEAFDGHGLVNNISNILSHEAIAIIGLNANVNKKDHMAYVNLSLEIENLALLDQIVAKLKQLPEITKINRA
ncbi:MAG: bifunctional (p)ppGpp synthetase/guanosine-3',5'-bis(diphosphate) 3'-pyrophosphohydrolase, partial [Gammaproteobacteria bacterium]|nr:bifunctional (p)ppGpp synthetase/guanosine-3',5'-bis(diphosphate) 3'-pyrophosphohydrolase [Gammaproteobacteria bacterium]